MICPMCGSEFEKIHHLQKYCKKECGAKFFRKINKEDLKNKKKEYYYKNKDKISKARKIYRENNKEKIKNQKHIYYQKNKEHIALKSKEWREKNHKKIVEYDKQYYADHKEESKLYSQKYQKKNRKKLNEYGRKYYKEHPEKMRQYYYKKKSKDIVKMRKQKNKNAKRYYKKNRKKVLQKAKEYNKKPSTRKRIREYSNKRYASDYNFKMARLIRNRIKKVLKNNSKSTSTTKLLGCSIQHLRSHLESQFTEGMSWDNYGLHGWHIDHILPCSSFDLSKPEEQKKCFHYTNLQPLWAKDNLSKSNKLDWSRD